PDLHSFPTRRSSDLDETPERLGVARTNPPTELTLLFGGQTRQPRERTQVSLQRIVVHAAILRRYAAHDERRVLGGASGALSLVSTVTVDGVARTRSVGEDFTSAVLRRCSQSPRPRASSCFTYS